MFCCEVMEEGVTLTCMPGWSFYWFRHRALQHIEQLLYLIQQFPGSAESTTQHSDQDVQGLMQQIRLRYRMMCSALGVRPRVHTATMSI